MEKTLNKDLLKKKKTTQLFKLIEEWKEEDQANLEEVFLHIFIYHPIYHPSQ